MTTHEEIKAFVLQACEEKWGIKPSPSVWNRLWRRLMDDEVFLAIFRAAASTGNLAYKVQLTWLFAGAHLVSAYMPKKNEAVTRGEEQDEPV